MKILLFLLLFPIWGRADWPQFQYDAAKTGKTEMIGQAETLLWSQQLPGTIAPFSGPAIKDSLIVIPTHTGLYCLNLDGDSLWVIEREGGFYNVPVIHSLIIVSAGNNLLGISLNGDSLWAVTLSHQIWQPTFWGSYVFVTEGNRLWKISLSGDTVWSRYCPSGFFNAGPAVDDSGNIFVATLAFLILPDSYAFRLYGFNQEGDQIFFHQEWTISEPGGNRITPTLTPYGVILATYPQSGWLHGSYLVYFTGGRRRWEGTMRYSSAVCDVSRNRIYHVDGNTIIARDLAGNFIWQSPNLGIISYSSPAIDGEDKIFVGSDPGVFYIINPDGMIRFQFDTGAGILTHPAISNGKVFIASTAGRLYCFGPSVVGGTEERLNMPTKFALFQNYPNPFNGLTNFEFGMPQEEFVVLRVYNALGQEVAKVIEGKFLAGTHRASWDVENLPSGIYFYRLEAGDFRAVKKMLLMK